MPAWLDQRHHGGSARVTGAARQPLLLLLSGLMLAAAPLSSPRAQDAPPQQVQSVGPYADFVAEASQRFGVPVAWIRAVMRVESRDQVGAVSPKGAMGLMQIMPDTWAELRARYRLGTDPFEPRDNILAGTAYLRELHDRYGAPGFLAAYNAGPGRYEEYRDTGRALPAETRAYVAQLAPLVGGERLPGSVVVATADPLAWTRAPLFVGAAERISTAPEPQAGEQSRAGDAADPPRDVAANATPTGGLFVSRREAAGPQ